MYLDSESWEIKKRAKMGRRFFKNVKVWNWKLLIALILIEILAIILIWTKSELGLNLGSELIGILLTVVIIDQIYLGREEKKLKRKIIRMLVDGSEEAIRNAYEEIKAEGWDRDGSLNNLVFIDRDFSDMEFMNAYFVNCTFFGVNFANSDLRGLEFNGGIFPDISFVGADSKPAYLHICEGATRLSDGRTDATSGKLVSYLVSDFVKARESISQQG